MRTLTVAALLCASVVVTAHSNIPKYRSRVYSIDRQTNFSKLKTYSWLESHLVADAELHAQIVAAVDRELAAVGMTKAPPGLGEVGVTYDAYSRTDVAVYEHPVAKRVRPMYGVGILVVSVVEPRNFRALLELRADIPVERTERAAIADATVAEMFKLYPQRRQ
ncbi:MAG TPA: DUF4136 domain-containing protein [Vicinamibacterales bacterium]|nr:DUF4136 domain-containing protein [Vicinamibacterales bacterium]